MSCLKVASSQKKKNDISHRAKEDDCSRPGGNDGHVGFIVLMVLMGPMVKTIIMEIIAWMTIMIMVLTKTTYGTNNLIMADMMDMIYMADMLDIADMMTSVQMILIIIMVLIGWL